MPVIVYYLGLAALCTHEMDAVMRSEWRLLYVLRDLDDTLAYTWFVGLHLPLFFLFFWLSHHGNVRLREGFRVLVAAFLAVHAGLHFRLSGSPDYLFEGWLSNGLIFFAGACGLVYIALVVRNRSPHSRQQGG